MWVGGCFWIKSMDINGLCLILDRLVHFRKEEVFRPSSLLFLAFISTHNLLGFYDALAALALWNLAML